MKAAVIIGLIWILISVVFLYFNYRFHQRRIAAQDRIFFNDQQGRDDGV